MARPPDERSATARPGRFESRHNKEAFNTLQSKPRPAGRQVRRAVLRDVLALAGAGQHLFPMALDRKGRKHPLTDHGHKDATVDAARLTESWTRNPDALVTVRTGAPSGLCVLDIDSGRYEDALDWEADNAPRLCETFAYRTISGGSHDWYHWQPGLRSCKLAPHVEFLADNASAIAWFLHGCPRIGTHPIAQVPEWIAELAAVKPQPAQPKIEPPSPEEDRRIQRYCTAALDRESAILASTHGGNRNRQLNASAFNLGQLHWFGWFTEAKARDRLRQACMENGLLVDDGEPQLGKTFASGWAAGLRDPRGLPRSAA